MDKQIYKYGEREDARLWNMITLNVVTVWNL